MPDVNFLKKSVVKVQQRSAFDKSFRNLLTTKCGTLTPLMCDEVIPNTTVNLKLAINCTLPPLASETFMNVNLKTEAFFVPSRLLMLGFEKFIMGDTDIKVGSNYSSTTDQKLRVPLIKMVAGASSTTDYIGAGSLADYLGCRISWLTANSTTYLNAMPFLAYHLIWDTWYRNSLIQKSCFDDEDYYNTYPLWTPRAMKYKYPTDHPSYDFTCYLNAELADGVRIGQLRQRNFGSDYFTVATPSPQNGDASKVTVVMPSSGYTFTGDNGDLYGDFTAATGSALDQFSMDGDTMAEGVGFNLQGSLSREEGGIGSLNPTGTFTISALRAANSLQQWLERNNIAGNRLVDFVKAQYNANLKDSIAQRPVYLGSASFPVYSKGIYQTAKDSNTGNNPFNSVGSRYGHAYAEGTDFIIDHFTAQEPGYIFVLASLVPEATYSSGTNKYLLRYRDSDSYGEMANPILQNIGNEPISTQELDEYFDPNPFVFGYTDRYASWMTRSNELHGLLRDGETLESFALQRSLASVGGQTMPISSDFLRIPVNFMDQVTAVDQAISQYGCWIDSYLDYKVVMPLARYSVPSLQDPAYEHGDTVVLDRAGKHID